MSHRKTSMISDSITRKIPEQARLDFERVRCKRYKSLVAARKDILSTFQYYTGSELRRRHLPYHICVLKELEETKYHNSFEKLINLLIDNEETEENDKTGFTQMLYDSKYMMDVLKDTLVRAEVAEFDKDAVKQCKILSAGAHRILNIGLGKEPASKITHLDGRGWFWLALRLLEIALDIAQTIKIDGGEREAVQRYMLAKFLLDIYPEDNPVRAEDLLKKARLMSLGMDHWKMDEDEGDKDSTLISCICLLMANMYIEIGRILIKKDPSEALVVCKKAVKRARETSSVSKLSEAIIKRGFCYMKMKHLELALDDFLYVLCVQEKNDDKNGICEAHITLSLIYQEMKRIPEARQHLENIIQLASTHNLRLWEAMGYWRLGELLLNEGVFEESASSFFKAYQLYSGGRQSLSARRVHSIELDSLTQGASQFQAPRKTMLNQMYRSSVKFHVYDMKDKIMNKVGTGFLYIPGPNNLPMKLGTSEYRSAAMGSLMSSDTSRVSVVSTTIQPGSVKKFKKARRRQKAVQYFLDDNDPEDVEMNTYMDTTNAEELNLIRCLYGVAKAHQYLNIFYEEVEKCQWSQRARHRIISWKLNETPFWENRDQSEERILPERREIKLNSEDEMSLDWQPIDLPKLSHES